MILLVITGYAICLIKYEKNNKELSRLQKAKEKAQRDLDAILDMLQLMQGQEESVVTEAKQEAAKSIEAIQLEVQDARLKLEDIKSALQAAQAQKFDEIEKEDFLSVHCLQLPDSAYHDIQILHEIEKSLIDKQAVQKLIWTQYYQKPLQILRQTLAADGKTGIYRIYFKDDGRSYVGQAVDIGARWVTHVKTTLRLSPGESKFYKALREHGIENFVFTILEECPSSKLNEKESYWIDFYNSIQFGFNTKKV